MMSILPHPQDFLFSASLLSANFLALGEEVTAVEKGGVDWLHLDMMDHDYVPQLSFGSFLCHQLKQHSALPLDVHLMVSDNDRYVHELIAAGVHAISFHLENTRHPHRLISTLKAAGCLVGIALIPSQPLSVLDYLLDSIDFVLIMSVNPGFSGQSFIPEMQNKIQHTTAYLAQYARHSGRHLPIQVDGGIHADNIASIYQAGARLFVMGSALFNTPKTPEEALHTLRKTLQELTLP